jgi:hypothetical protein
MDSEPLVQVFSFRQRHRIPHIATASNTIFSIRFSSTTSTSKIPKLDLLSQRRLCVLVQVVALGAVAVTLLRPEGLVAAEQVVHGEGALVFK